MVLVLFTGCTKGYPVFFATLEVFCKICAASSCGDCFLVKVDILNITVISFKIKDDCNIGQQSN